MEKRIGRTVLVVGCLLAALALLAACKPAGSAAAAGNAAKLFAAGEIAPNTFANLTNTVKLPLTKKPVTFKVISWQESAQAAPRGEFQTYRELEKRTGVHVEWMEAPGEKYTEYFTGVFAAATSLPDLAVVEGDWARVNRNLLEFSKAGMIVPLENLIVKNAPNLKAFLDRRPDIRKLITAPDGHIYTIPSVSGSQYFYYAHIVRQDWLDKLNLQAPNTVDEWIAVLKAFRDGDPNGNGVRDEIQLLEGGPAGIIEWGPFKSAYGLLLNYGGGWAVDKAAGRVTYAWLSPKAKEYVELLKRLYTERIFRREEFDDPSFPGKWSELLFSGRTGIASYGIFDVNPDGIYQSMQDKNARWTQIMDAQGPDGTRMMEGAGLINANNFVLTKACKDPALAMKWVDYWFASRDGYLLTTWGIEGETYQIVEGHPVTLLDSAAEDVKKKWEATRLPDGPIPHIQLEDENWAAQKHAETQAFLALAKPYIFNTSSLKDVIATSEEAEVMSKYWDGLWAYQNEMIAKFVTGKEPMENWDTFVAELKKLGAEEVTTVKQAQYDRATK